MPSDGARTSAIPWWRRLGPRVRTLAPYKAIGTMLIIPVFFWAYFWVLHHPQGDVTVMPLTWLDGVIGFEPAAIPLYVSLWLYVSLAPAFLKDRREVVSYAVATIALSVVGLLIFLLWPTTVVVNDADWGAHASLAFLKELDAPRNACPSLHVAFAVFTGLWFERMLRELGAGWTPRVLNLLWCLGILWSTMAIRQHVALDAYAGTALGAVAAWLQMRWLDGSPALPAAARTPGAQPVASGK